MSFLHRVGASTRSLVRLDRIVRVFICSALAWFAYRLFENNDGMSIRFASRQAFNLSLTFIVFASCSIAFWHAALYPIVLGRFRPRWRIPLLRSIDYVWYVAALVSAVLIVNELQINELTRQRDYLDRDFDYNVELGRKYNAEMREKDCAFLLKGMTAQDETTFDIDKMQLATMCHGDVQREQDETLFVRACDAAAMVSHSNDARFYSPEKIDQKRDALNELSMLCTVFHDHSSIPKDRDEIDNIIEQSSLLPSQKSGSWLYILATVIGLRLTRTTAEFVEALRESSISTPVNRLPLLSDPEAHIS
ncbi:hypothetical protein LB531_03075 [Mesorhizobium sp. CO1-1-2]|uniref:hypothetical protein n=1 Tax=Mesorhizobium sp. CO1-1-2 TaxID=2876635 RepID=UPI001CCFBC4A|nr:hypothetical protein [Mesorhizobium sp. CO1-1-2]MBZ9679636.1 hypothetical protein [Mesorhizobium sp. CO1-1-2]